MKIILANSNLDPEDQLVTFKLTTETKTHKTTLQFHEHADAFAEFARSLQQFPFENEQPVIFEIGDWKKSAYSLRLLVELIDTVGHAKFTVNTHDAHKNESALFADIVEVAPLHDLANKFAASDFTVRSEFIWQS